MDKPNPFVIKIPKGATEIDLGPLLRPIIWSIREEMRVHDGRQHWGSRSEKQASQIDPNEIDALMSRAINGLKYQELLRGLKRPVLVAYLKAHEWTDEDDRGYCFVHSYYKDHPRWDYRGPRLHLHNPREGFKLYVADDVVSKLSYSEQKPKLAMLKEILSFENILDRIANELE